MITRMRYVKHNHIVKGHDISMETFDKKVIDKISEYCENLEINYISELDLTLTSVSFDKDGE